MIETVKSSKNNPLETISMMFSTNDQTAQEAQVINLSKNIMMFNFGTGCPCGTCQEHYNDIPVSRIV